MNLPFLEIGSEQAEEKSRKFYTYEDYRKLPEGAPYQLIGGELVLTPAPGTYHQIISMKLEFQMVDFVSKNGLGIVLYAPIDVYLEETETYQPDIIFIAQERMGIIEPARVNGAPDLVVEILSPATAYYDLRKKYKVYEKSGVKEYWIVDPEEKSVQVFLLKEGKFALDQEAAIQDTVTSRIIEGLTVSLESIF
ncbi:MAG: Uma2 family endonuclease [Firmicutes bacterium]|nr:Uma2 family endonuclease [Bacillota bacterium]